MTELGVSTKVTKARPPIGSWFRPFRVRKNNRRSGLANEYQPSGVGCRERGPAEAGLGWETCPDSAGAALGPSGVEADA